MFINFINNQMKVNSKNRKMAYHFSLIRLEKFQYCKNIYCWQGQKEVDTLTHF